MSVGTVCAYALETDSIAADTAIIKYDILQDMAERVTVHQSKDIELLMNGKLYGTPRSANNDKKPLLSANPWGYRVEVFNSNDQRNGKQQAEQIRAQLAGRVNGHNVYMRFDTPFWRVRVGDFRTLDEAKAYLKVFKQRFPTLGSRAYVWRDHIRVNVISTEPSTPSK